MFRHKVQHLDWPPENGMQVEVRAYPTLYEARGKFQLNVEVIRRAGLGALYEAFEKLKARLEKEGLFAAAGKKPLPQFPCAVGVVTSPQAAALRDVLTTLRRRMPALPVILYPAPVQGEGASGQIARALAAAATRQECDVIIVCRGGGSIEDLWAYNEEAVARAIHACPIPVVTGVGHETDFTIADFVADARAPTPTAAAELASPDRADLARQLIHWYHRLSRIIERALEARMQRVDYLSKCVTHPGERIRTQLGHLQQLASRLRGAAKPDLELRQRDKDDLGRRLREAARNQLKTTAAHIKGIETQLKHLNPQLVLERGYSITESGAGNIVRDGSRLAIGDEVKITFAKGWAGAEVKRKG
jgi:exodeoxyribonuclease VII large subunit